MKVLITGGAGFLGQRLARSLVETGSLRVNGVERPLGKLVLLDHVEPSGAALPGVRAVRGDVRDAALLDRLVDDDTAVVYHLAAIVSGQAEAEFDLGLSINLDASRALLETCRRRGQRPRVVFTSSVAVYGGALPEVVTDDTVLAPRSSYGTAKAMAELLLAEYHRRGFVDGLALRLPTVSVRPGRPNQAASSFASSIIREPVNGEVAHCPVPGHTRVWLMSPRVAIDSLVHAAGVDRAALPTHPGLNLCGLSLTVDEMLAALARVAGEEVAARVRFSPDEQVQRIVGGWPGAWDMATAHRLGFPRHDDFDAVIREHLASTGNEAGGRQATAEG